MNPTRFLEWWKKKAAMQPKIDETRFGSITTAAKTLKHAVIIRLNGSVEKRGKKLSKDLCSTSHIIPAREVEEAYESGTKWMVLGAGQSGMAGLSAGAAALLESKGCMVKQLPTAVAIRYRNGTESPAVGLFHVTC